MSPSARGQPKFGVPHVTPGPRGNVLPGKAVQKVLERLRDKILDAPVAKGDWESHEPMANCSRGAASKGADTPGRSGAQISHRASDSQASRPELMCRG